MSRFEANFNPNLRMSTAAMSSVKFKLDKEKAKYEKTIKILNLSEKMEMRIAQKQLEEVKKELTLMRAYQYVAKQMAFKNFDPVIRRRRERREKERQLEEEAALQRQQEEEDEEERQHRLNDDDNNDNGNSAPGDNRRLSKNGNVFVTLQDIMGNDEVLRRNSRQINENRRKSKASLESLDYGDDSLQRTRRKTNASPIGKTFSPRRGSMASVGSAEDDNVKSVRVDYKDNDGNDEIDGETGSIETSTGNLLDCSRGISQRRKKSRAGSSFGIVGLDSIEENCSEGDKETVKFVSDENQKEQRESKTNSLVVSGRKGFKTTGNLVKGFFITSTDDNEEKSKKKSKVNERGIDDNRDKPMSIYQLSKFYEQQKSVHMEENKTKEINQQKRLERRKYESLRRRLQKEKFENGKRSSKKSSGKNKASSAPDKRNTDSPSLNDTVSIAEPIPASTTDDSVEETQVVRSTTVPLIKEPETDADKLNEESSEPNPNAALKGLARFKNAATKVSVQLMVANPEKSNTSNRLKHIAAAVMMKENSNPGRVPKAFMYSNDFADRFGRERDKSKATTLEASHRKPEDCKIRPLAMPESVKAEYAVKWQSLMGSVNSAVHWKVKALREDTGTLNSRQIRRQAREEQPSVIDVSPRTPRNPPRSVFPGACKTTWAVKKFVSQEIKDVLKAWQPENVRRKKNQRMKTKVSLPDFIDRVRTTNSILNSFRSYCKEKKDKKNSDDDDGGDGGDVDVGVDEYGDGDHNVNDDFDSDSDSIETGEIFV